MIALIEPTAPPASDPIPSLLKKVSASRLNCWLQCRLKFLFRYVEEIKKPPTPSLHIGTVVHEVLQSWNMARWKKQPFMIERFKTLFDQSWADQAGIDWEGEEPGLKSETWRLLEVYFTDTPIKADEMPEAVEVPMEMDLAQHGLPVLVGVIDLVRSGRRIVDFKTAAKTPSPQDALHQNELQLSCYSVLYREATGELEAGRELHHLIKTKTPKLIITAMPPMSEGQQTRLFRVIESYQDGLAREDFVPSVGLQCCACEFFNECRRWS